MGSTLRVHGEGALVPGEGTQQRSCRNPAQRQTQERRAPRAHSNTDPQGLSTPELRPRSLAEKRELQVLWNEQAWQALPH